MLNWYKNLYVGDNAKKKQKKLIRKINQGAGVIDIYLVTLAVNPANSLVEQIAEEVYEETGAMDIRGWLLEKAARVKKRD